MSEFICTFSNAASVPEKSMGWAESKTYGMASTDDVMELSTLSVTERNV